MMKRRTFLQSAAAAGAVSMARLVGAAETAGTENKPQSDTVNAAGDWGIRFTGASNLERALRIAADIYPRNRRNDGLSQFYATRYRMTVSPGGFPLALCISPDLTFGVLGSRFVRDECFLETFRGMLDMMPRNMRRNGRLFINEDMLIGCERAMSQVMYLVWIWELYLALGDLEILKRHHQPMLRCLGYIESRTNAEGVVNQVDHDDWQISEGADWVDWSPERLEGSTCVYHAWYARALQYCEQVFRTLGDPASADMARQRAERQRKVLSTHFWNGKSYYDNLNFNGQKVDHFWVDSQVWPIAWGFASAEQAAAVFRRIDAEPAYFEGTPMRWCPSIPEAEAARLAKDYPDVPREPHLRPFSWFGRLGAGAILARRTVGQDAHAYQLLDRYAQLVVKHGTCVECLDMDGNVQPGTAGGRDYLEHAGGLLWAAGRGIWGIDDTADGTVVWRPWLPPETTRVSMPFWHQGHCWTFGYDDGQYWIDPKEGQGTVRFILGGKQTEVSLSRKRTVVGRG